jgi:hypothetical protein
MKCLQLVGLAAAVGGTFLAQTSGFAHGGHGHSGGHSHPSGGSHHSTAHHSAPHHSAPHAAPQHAAPHHSAPPHSTAHAAPHHSAPQTAGPVHPSHPHGTPHHASPSPSFAHQGHNWSHHNWSNGHRHHGYHSYWNNGYWSGPWGVWGDGTVTPTVNSPWYYESFFNVEPETAVLPQNGPTVTRGCMSRATQPTSPPVGVASTTPAEVGPTESDGN